MHSAFSLPNGGKAASRVDEAGLSGSAVGRIGQRCVVWSVCSVARFVLRLKLLLATVADCNYCSLFGGSSPRSISSLTSPIVD